VSVSRLQVHRLVMTMMTVMMTMKQKVIVRQITGKLFTSGSDGSRLDFVKNSSLKRSLAYEQLKTGSPVRFILMENLRSL
jgi:hypothetical protein